MSEGENVSRGYGDASERAKESLQSRLAHQLAHQMHVEGVRIDRKQTAVALSGRSRAFVYDPREPKGSRDVTSAILDRLADAVLLQLDELERQERAG